MSSLRTDLLTPGGRLHNKTEALDGSLRFRTDAAQWSYSVSFPLDITRLQPGEQPLVAVHLQVTEGAVGIGVLDEHLDRFITSEIDAVASSSPVRVELRPAAGTSRGHLMFRNIASGGHRSCFQVNGVELLFEQADSALLRARTPPRVNSTVHTSLSMDGTFDIFVSHTSRRWLAEQCDRRYLERRYAKPDRLRNLPLLTSLPPNTAPYHGLLSMFRIDVNRSGITGSVLRHYVSSEKVVHAATSGDKVVVCFDAGVASFARREETTLVDLEPATGRYITDPWFGGLHTVIPGDDCLCLVSSSGADAILWLDISTNSVVRRWRLPATHYGTNYDLDETTWLSEHYIPNDFQLGHLNCAAPDSRGGAFFSVLGQGDIGHVDRDGRTEILVRGHVGCHGVRYSRGNRLLYFCDSCGGRLMRVDGADRTTTLFETGSRWLHDAVHLTGALFLLSLGDRNRLVLADVESKRTVAEWQFSESDGTVQFLSVAGSWPATP